ncbi:unnamed protein product [Gadus morhua 'NCC']|uniref:probable methyltransferase-like protein 24 n=1 Tax=Gadus chalcogrammus TaxID=1042646 RepID=UPI0024C4D05F|nr:probable methyltransferase-like protein 24 [Gadus chalcogrammus]
MPPADLRGVIPRVAILLIPPILITIQLMVVFRLPQDQRDTGTAADGTGIVYSVISIEPRRSARHGTASTSAGTLGLPGVGRAEGAEEMEKRDDRGYEDENEMPTRQARGFVLQSWAAEEPSFTAELNRILPFISRPQVNCSRVLSPGESQASQVSGSPDLRWLLCAEEWLLPAEKKTCVAYSFSMDGGDADFIKTVLGLGCEVHRFDPSYSNASGGHRGNSLASSHGDDGGSGVVIKHKMWLEWRSLRKGTRRKRGILGSVSQTLRDIMQALSHHKVDFLYADLLSAEWRIFQNWMEQGTLLSIQHLVATVHLQWAGFEVDGTNEEVVRYWFSILHGLKASGFQLVHSSPGEGRSVLKQSTASTHSSYTLSWVNMEN